MLAESNLVNGFTISIASKFGAHFNLQPTNAATSFQANYRNYDKNYRHGTIGRRTLFNIERPLGGSGCSGGGF